MTAPLVGTPRRMLLLLALGAVGTACGGGPPAASRPGSDRPTEAPTAVEARPARRAGAVLPEPPTGVRLPDGTRVPVLAVGTRPDGLLDVPGDIRRAGWWQGGSRLGDPWGATLLAAHVDSTTQGLGPFASLLAVRPDARFVVSSASLRQTFRATSLRLIDQGPLVRHRWMFGAGGERRIVMVTCAPPYVRERGGYQRLAVVTAVPVSAPTRRAHPQEAP